MLLKSQSRGLNWQLSPLPAPTKGRKSCDHMQGMLWKAWGETWLAQVTPSLQTCDIGRGEAGLGSLRWKAPEDHTKKRDGRGWDGWMASLTQWIWVWANSRRWWRTGKPGMLQSMGLQRQDWASELKWNTLMNLKGKAQKGQTTLNNLPALHNIVE